MRILLRLAALLAVLVLLLAGLLFFGLDAALRAAVEKGGSQVLGVPTRLESVSLGLFSGSLELAGLEVANPPGFDAQPFLALGSGHTQVSLASLGGDVARVELLELGDIALLLQRRKGRTNYGVILENLGSRASPGEQPPGGESRGESAGGKQFVIERVVIRNLVADFDLLPGGGELARAQVTIPEIRLENVGTAEDGASAVEVARRLIEAILQASLEAGGQVLAPELLGDLEARLDDLSAQGVELSRAAADELIEKLPISEELGEKLGEEAGKALEDLGKGLDGLLQKKKKKD